MRMYANSSDLTGMWVGRTLWHMAADYIGFRLPIEDRVRLELIAQDQGLTLSEMLRALCSAALNGQVALRIDEGYAQARASAIQIVHALLRQAAESIPATYEEAIAQYSLNGGPGRGGG